MLEQQFEQWRGRHESDPDAVRPVLYFMNERDDVGRLERFLADARDVLVVDGYDRMLRELFIVDHPPLKADPEKLRVGYESWLREHRGDRNSLDRCGVWAYYPWSRQLVHVPVADDYYRLRTARNRNLVTAEEQRRLRAVRIGIIGLSVGQAPALTLTISGIGRSMRLADPDTIDGSNLNRIHAGIADVGRKKTTVLGRRMTELDPYVTPEIFPTAITEKNVESFLTGGGNLDVVLDACDDIPMKIKLRIAARKQRIPVLMATDLADGALLDIERYDLDPETPMFGGRVEEHVLADLPAVLEFKDTARLAIGMIGVDPLPRRMMESIQVLGTHLAGYPQLGLASFLGGALATYAIKRIALGDQHLPPRVSTSLEQLFTT